MVTAGCSDSDACNYDPDIIVAYDDICAFPGCNDDTACNYNSEAGCDDGSCYHMAWYIPFSIESFGPMLFTCDPPEGYFLADQSCAAQLAINDPYCVDTSFDEICLEAYNCCIDVPQCTDPNSCNYTPVLCDTSSQECIYPGCTDPSACNYDPNAGCDDGSCAPAPVNDLCADALPLIEGDNYFDNSGNCSVENYSIPAGMSEGPFGHCRANDGWCAFDTEIQSDIYFYFELAQETSVTLNINTENDAEALSDSQLAVFEGCGGTLVGANDDQQNFQEDSYLHFECGILQANVTYIVLIDGQFGEEGDGILSFTLGNEPACVFGCYDSECPVIMTLRLQQMMDLAFTLAARTLQPVTLIPIQVARTCVIMHQLMICAQELLR